MQRLRMGEIPHPQLRCGNPRCYPGAIDLDTVAPSDRLYPDIELHALRLLNRREPVLVHVHDLDHLRGHAEFEFLHFVH